MCFIMENLYWACSCQCYIVMVQVILHALGFITWEETTLWDYIGNVTVHVRDSAGIKCDHDCACVLCSPLSYCLHVAQSGQNLARSVSSTNTATGRICKSNAWRLQNTSPILCQGKSVTHIAYYKVHGFHSYTHALLATESHEHTRS